MATLEQNIAELQQIKADIKTAVAEKGVVLGDDMRTYADGIRDITVGASTVVMSQAEYDALSEIDYNKIYLIQG